jgi:predicted SprT family Zn-dependent metalloprotease
MELKQASKLAIKLMDKHGLLGQGWYFTFDRSNQRFGSCQYLRKRITLSKYLTELNSEQEIQNTILHEIAHALCPGQHHNHIWKAKAKEIGCTGDRCYSYKQVIIPELKYSAVCSSCNEKYSRSRMGCRLTSCSKCNSKFDPKYILTFKLNPTLQINKLVKA